MDKKPTETNVKWVELPTSYQEKPPCKHYFEFIEGECRCKNCKMGLIGVVRLKDGRPY